MPKNKKKNLKKVRKHFKFNLERLAKHLGKIADNTSFKDIQEIALNAGLAYAGYERFKDWKGALLGPVSLKLATAPGGTPPVSQMAGIAGLSILGLAYAQDLFGVIKEQLQELPWMPEQQLKLEGKLPEGSYPIAPQRSCPTDYHKETFGYRYQAWCIPNEPIS